MINIILLLTFNKTQSANLNEKYALKVGNDFSYQGVNSAELAILKVRERQEQAKAQGNKGTSPHQPRARTAMFPSGANQTIKIKPVKQKRWILQRETTPVRKTESRR